MTQVTRLCIHSLLEHEHNYTRSNVRDTITNKQNPVSSHREIRYPTPIIHLTSVVVIYIKSLFHHNSTSAKVP